ncbi:cytochrome P450 [Nonomuraea jiangxiensis]|uniref:Cytochrome P450 n=1 Tax=Nonomuraea jiangxiensis TaxID=633440 RepID=A0A1G9V2X8_9ACTN|nr:cytochrome P450 [Nonomuraea jiangxiensis]SDM66443.1 Cytochrome P450 [Nonomuraea jiangxiensis]
MLIALLLAAAVVVSLPWWLPGRVVALRVRVFARINGDEGIPVPGDLVGIERFKEVYAHPAAGGRSRGAALSDVFWYWLSPGPEMHQEHLEAGERYESVARVTRGLLAVPRAEAEELTRRCAARTLNDARGLVRLRDLMMPLWAEFSYELVFAEPCPRAARDLIVGNASDVSASLKCTSLRHMERRHRLTRYLLTRLPEVRVPLPSGLSPLEQAFYLHGAFFTTAVVQMSEAMAHLLMVLAQHPGVQARARTDDAHYLDQVIAETLRLYPLFGIAHRITTAGIPLDEHTTIPAGSVLCFNYPEFHRAGFDDPGRFDPARFDPARVDRPAKDLNHIPFGIAANRPCPAWRLAPIVMRVAAWDVLRRYALHSSAAHTRSMPNRGPCLLTPLQAAGNVRAALLFMSFRDRWEDVWRSVVQLVLGTYMVWDARRKRLCEHYFDDPSENRHAHPGRRDRPGHAP